MANYITGPIEREALFEAVRSALGMPGRDLVVWPVPGRHEDLGQHFVFEAFVFGDGEHDRASVDFVAIDGGRVVIGASYSIPSAYPQWAPPLSKLPRL